MLSYTLHSLHEIKVKYSNTGLSSDLNDMKQLEN